MHGRVIINALPGQKRLLAAPLVDGFFVRKCACMQHAKCDVISLQIGTYGKMILFEVKRCGFILKTPRLHSFNE